ncbi:MAG: hypothetical protein BMS9Abin19_0871 [Gammaproteobacteria bacterium]|nr:MAG: hypothetical protein BMS9Abin19_0871 [Gammaproteobacteria bacterium]
MEKLFVPIFLISIVVMTVSIQPNAGATADDLNMNNIKDSNDKKKRFFDFMRPIINDENARVLALREKLLDAKKNKNKHGLVSTIAENYSVEWTADKKTWRNYWSALTQ